MINNIVLLKFGGSMYVILIYDIKIDGEGSKIWRNVFKITKKYLFHIQNSVFEGEIDIHRLEKLKCELKLWLRDIDSCIIFKSRSKKWLDKEFLTEVVDSTSNFI